MLKRSTITQNPLSRFMSIGTQAMNIIFGKNKNIERVV